MSTSEFIQVASFLVLAILTAWYAYQTHKLADLTERTAEAAERSAESTDRLVHLEFLPIVWIRKAQHEAPDLLNIMARNVGSGLPWT